MSVESSEDGRDNGGWKAPPTDADLDRRMEEMIENMKIFPAQEQDMRLNMQRDSLDEAADAVRSLEEIRTGRRLESDCEPYQLEQWRSVAQYYPGYREQDVRDLLQRLPETLVP